MTNNAAEQILFITTDLPYPADGGGRIKTFRLLKFLTEHFQVKLICAYGGHRKLDIDAFRKEITLASFQAFKNHRKRNALNMIKAFLFAPTLNSYRLESSEITSMIEWSAAQADLVIVDHLESYHLLPEKFKFKTIYHSHNAEFRLWKDFAKLQGGIKKLFLQWEANRVKALERYAISRSVFSFVAPNDQAAIQDEIGFKDDAFRLTYHLGHDRLLNSPSIDLAANPKQVVYTGTLDWEPNRDGLNWFLQKVWPLIIKNDPEITLSVCGKGADEDLKKLMSHLSGVYYKGYVEDLDAELSKSRCAIVPLRFGSGMKIKTLDAMYRGLPLVSTDSGVEGLEVINNKHAIIVNVANGFAEAILSIINDVTNATTLRDNARALCREQYTYEQLFNGMLSAIKDALGQNDASSG